MSCCDVVLEAAQTPPKSHETSRDQISAMLPSSASPPQPGEIMPASVDSIETAVLQRPDSEARVDDGESPDARIERLGRARPENFKTLWAEVGFVFSIVMSQVLTVSARS